MDRFKRNLKFWAVMLGVVVLVPATLLANKQTYKAAVKAPAGTPQIGSALLQTALGGFVELRATSNVNAQGMVVQKVVVTDGSWAITACETGGPVQDDCTYDVSGRLLLDVDITGPMLQAAGINGATFQNAVQAETVSVEYYDGGSALLGSGVLMCIMGPAC